MFERILLLTIGASLALIVATVVALAYSVDKRLRIALLCTIIPLTLWQISIAFADYATSNVLLWNHIVFLWPTIGVASFYVFLGFLRSSSLAGPAKKWRYPKQPVWQNTLLVVALSTQLLAIASGNIFTDVLREADGMQVFTRGIAYIPYIVGLFVLVIFVIARLVASVRATAQVPQGNRALKQIQWTVIAACVFGLVTNVFVPILTGSQQYIALGILTVDILAIGFALSIIRSKFLDIRVYAFTATAYVFAVLLTLIVYAAISGFLSVYVLQIDLSIRTLAVLSLITLAMAVAFQPLRTWFNHVTNRVFSRDYYDPQEVLDKIGKLLIRSVDLDEIIRESKQIIGSALKGSNVDFRLSLNMPGDRVLPLFDKVASPVFSMQEVRDKSGVIPHHVRQEVALIVRLSSKNGNLGYLLLGFKKSGSDYTFADKKLLGLVAAQLAIGLQNAIRFEQIEQFNVTLQAKVDEATQQLRRTNEKLKALDETKDDFISMASHQLRTPLTSIKGYISMVLEGDAGKINEMQQKMLDQAFVSSQRMVYLIADLLNVSRLKTGKFVIEKTPINLADMVEQELSQLTEAAKSRNLTLVYHRPDNFPSIMLDETKTRQVVMNFADNAIYYTPAGGTIEIKLADNPKSVELTVVDNGIGVPKPIQHHLFTKFYRAPNAKHARPDGTGLGLFMAKKVIIAQGGALIFHSQEGKGSTFGFSFPKSDETTKA